MNAKRKAIELLLNFRFKNKFKISDESDDFLLCESDCYKIIDIAIKEAKEEICDDIYQKVKEDFEYCKKSSKNVWDESWLKSEILKTKQRHLSSDNDININHWEKKYLAKQRKKHPQNMPIKELNRKIKNAKRSYFNRHHKEFEDEKK